MQYTRAEPHNSFTVENNIFMSDGGPMLGNGGWAGGNYRFKDNTYARTDGKPVDWAGMDIEAWRKKSGEERSFLVGVRFVDANDGDLRLKDYVPPGFQPFARQAASARPRGLPRTVEGTFPTPVSFPQ